MQISHPSCVERIDALARGEERLRVERGPGSAQRAALGRRRAAPVQNVLARALRPIPIGAEVVLHPYRANWDTVVYRVGAREGGFLFLNLPRPLWPGLDDLIRTGTLAETLAEEQARLASTGALRPLRSLDDLAVVGVFSSVDDELIQAPFGGSTAKKKKTSRPPCGMDGAETVYPYTKSPLGLPGDPIAIQNGALAGFGVHLADGSFFYETDDLVVPSVALPFAFERTYRSHLQILQGGILGHGWDFSYNRQVVPVGGTVQEGQIRETAGELVPVDYLDGTGRRDRYVAVSHTWATVKNFGTTFRARITTYRSPAGRTSISFCATSSSTTRRRTRSPTTPTSRRKSACSTSCASRTACKRSMAVAGGSPTSSTGPTDSPRRTTTAQP
ncbi:MAG: DUF6531 domain-containing protein [Polyangiaceae bacterium]